MSKDPSHMGHRLGSLATRWSLVRRAHQGPAPAAADARKALVLRYASAIRGYVGAMTRDDELSDEIAQDVVVRMLGGDFGGADPDRGRFRDLLKTALRKNDDYELRAITVDSTSGTIIPVDGSGEPLYNALLHNDIRAQEEAQFITEETGISVKPSFALPKILWIKNNLPDLFESTHRFIHAADYIKGLVSGSFGTTDFSNAVKTGYDLERNCWPDSIGDKLGIPVEKLPEVVKTGKFDQGTQVPRRGKKRDTA